VTRGPRPAVLAIVAAVAAILFGIGVLLDLHALRLAAKPWPVVALALWVWRDAPAGPYRRWLTLGLAASLAGDLFLELSPRALFVPGLVSFLIAHVLYVIAYASDTRALHLARAIPAYLYAVIVLVALWPGLGPMRVPVSVYTLVICTMIWRAAARVGAVPRTSAQLALAGAIVFALSDSMIALGRFGGHLLPEDIRTGWPLRVAIMSTYWLGQGAIAASAHRPVRKISGA
jgi:alkenylglycerophosphocholine/alkenylglycerophosphoethanolamine hydrolase